MKEETTIGKHRFTAYIPNGFASLRDWLLAPGEREGAPHGSMQLTEGATMRCGFSDGPQAPKPAIEPKGQGPVKPFFPPPRIIKESGPF